MEKSYTIRREGQQLLIDIRARKRFIIVMGLSVFALVYFLAASVMFVMLSAAMANADMTQYFAYIALGGGLIYTFLYVMLARSFIRRLTQHELITVSPTTLSLTDEYIFGRSKRSYKLEHIKTIFFAGAENFTAHPLDGNYGDLGFRGMEALVQYQISDGSMMMMYGSRQIRFGRNVPSWDAEEIVQAIGEHIGRSLIPKANIETEVEPPKKYRGGM